MKRVTSLALLLASLVLISCGGGSDSGDEVTTVANQINVAETSQEVSEVCEELLTPGFIEEVYGGEVKKCLAKPPNYEEENEDLGEIEVDAVETDGDVATAQVSVKGGDTDGSEGTWTFSDSGGGWQLDRIEDDYLRSTLLTSTAIVDGGAFAYEPMRECMTKQFEKLDSAALRNLMFQELRGDEQKGLKNILEISEGCPGQLAGYIADELATNVVAKRGATPGQVRCARKNLKPMLEITGLSKVAMAASIRPDEGEGTMAGPALAGLVAGVMKNCPR